MPKALRYAILFVVLGFATEIRSQTTLKWETQIICDSCYPLAGYFRDSNEAYVAVQRSREQGHRMNMFRNGVWKPSSTLGGVGQNGFCHPFSSPLPGHLFYAAQIQGRSFTSDYGETWNYLSMYPVPQFLRMNTIDTGLGIVQEKAENSQYRIAALATTDNGRYFYDSVGTLYHHKSQVYDALIRQNYDIFLVHLDGSVSASWDSAKTWQVASVFTPDDLSKVRQLNEFRSEKGSVIFAESVGQYSLAYSIDTGRSWSRMPDVNDATIYRYRPSITAKGMMLWGARGISSGAIYPDLMYQLAEPASKLVVSLDTGKTWNRIDFGVDGARIYDIAGFENSIQVISYKDSVLYFSRAYLASMAAVNAGEQSKLDFDVLPNPASHELQVVFNNDALNATVSVTNALGVEVLRTKASGRIDVSMLASGTYYLRITADGRTRTRRVIIEK